MDEGNTSGGASKSRSVLGDLTNRIGKRGFSDREKDGINNKVVVKRICVSSRPCTEINSLKGNVKSGISKIHNENRDPNATVLGGGYAASKNAIDVGAHFLKGKNVVSRSINELNPVNNDLVDSPGKLDLLKDSEILRIAQVADDSKCPSLQQSSKKNMVDLPIAGGSENALGSSKIYDAENDRNLLDLGRDDAIESLNIEVNNEFGDGSPADTSKTVSASGNDCLHDGQNCDAGELNVCLDGDEIDTNDCHNDVDDHHADNFVLSQSGSVDCTILHESQESRVFGLDSSAKLKEDECAYMSEGTDSIKACSCSFCTQAMKKSQKEASILAERSCRIKVTEKHEAENSTKVSKLESHLMCQWRSLFQRMSVIWEEEGNQLEASLLPLTDLREKCKTDLEFINAKLSEEKH